ncbi:DUF493 family protein [Anditalea andensis]|uniref:DUF493 domain-containing protein n=1 Tax=Anditalea andensis TaxID=1048983 RepID=A0A074KYA3_9BACT|nr:DUF493 family protein [Anditalea andensis]KEO73170.1 hypothetical protein EL17_12490 [Anditalea andensis]
MEKKFDKISFKEKLDAQTVFPAIYMFKFIVPNGRQDEIATLLPSNEMVVKASTKGKYVSATIKAMMPSSSAVIEIYEKASEIEGVIAL